MPTKKPAPLPPREERLRHQGKMLDEIMRHKREELPARMRAAPWATLRAFAATAPVPLDFAAALRQPGVNLIAEVKRASPSKGLLCRDFDPVQLALTYAQGGAAAISVLTDSRYFQGELEHLTAIKEALVYGPEETSGQKRRLLHVAPVPVLRKDFIFDSYQIVEARVAGADAVLLIAAVLGDHDLRSLLAEVHRHGMAALVEVHDEAEVERALGAGAQIIGINNRDLRTFAVDLATTARLRPLIPADRIVVSESGIHIPADVRRLADLRVNAMLVGESLVTAKPAERLAKVRELARAGKA
jgi:indole-3-glycerol phosphate synthase